MEEQHRGDESVGLPVEIHAATPHRRHVRFPVVQLVVSIAATLLLVTSALMKVRTTVNGGSHAIRTSLRLEELRSDIRYFDESRVMAARMALVTHDASWRERSRAAEKKLDSALNETVRLAPSELEETVVTQVFESKTRTAAMIESAFALLKSGKAADGLAVLDGAELARQHDIYSQGAAIVGNAVTRFNDITDLQEKQESKSAILSMLITACLVCSWTMLLIKLRSWHQGLLARVHNERERSENVLESISDGFFSVDRHWAFLYANQRAQGIQRVSNTPELGETLWRTFPTLRNTRFEQTIYGVMSRRVEATCEELLDPIGRWIEFQIYPSAEGVSCYFRDITHRKNAEHAVVTYTNQLEAAKLHAEEQSRELAIARDEALEATKAKSVFLANMSHEIRTPMNGVIGMTNLLLETPVSADQRDCLLTVRNSAESLLSIINDILDFSKLEAGRIELERVNFDLRQMVEEVTSLLGSQAAAKSLVLKCDIDEALPALMVGDPVRLRQIFTNVVGNAIKFTDEGSVTLTAAVQTLWQNAATVRIAVTDTGIGIPKDRLDKIFESFTQADSSTTRKYGGTGLGLTISRQLAELMGGSMKATSEIGRGSTFWIEVQLAIGDENAVAFDSIPEVINERPLAGTTVLLVEDNRVNQKVAVRMLESMGCIATVAENGAIGVDLWAAGDFDLILMDMLMPEMDGGEAARIIRKKEGRKGGRVPIVALTANAMLGDREKCLEAGMDDYLSKPVQKASLEQAVRKWARQQAESESLAA